MTLPDVLHDFNFVGLSAGGRAFPGFPSTSSQGHWQMAPRELLHLSIRRDDLLSISGLQDEHLLLLVINGDGQPSPAALNLQASPVPLTSSTVDLAELSHWLDAMGLPDSLLDAGSAVHTAGSEPLVLQATADCELWVAYPSGKLELVEGSFKSRVELTHQPATATDAVLPAALGRVKEEFTIPRGTARAYRLSAGEQVQIIDVEGQQCSDFQAFLSRDLDLGRESMIDPTATRSMVRGAYPGPGLFDKFFDQHMRPMLRVVQDTCGRHDTFGLACTARGYQERGFPGHRNCSDNISEAVNPHGVAKRNAWPAINFFWSTWIDQHSHHLLTEESWSRPGDYLVMQALDDMLCVSTACPDDIDPINGWNPTDIHVRIYHSDKPIRRAVAYRKKEDAPMVVSRESAFYPRVSELTNHFAPARDVWSAVSFPATGTLGEYWACREAVTLQDMSSLRKFDIIGPDAERLLQQVVTRDVNKLAVWRGTYALICDDTGAVIDDGTLFRLGPELFRWCCGSEESGRVLQATAAENRWQVRVHGLGSSLPNLALQGPQSRDLLRDIIFTQPHVPGIDQLKWFGVTVARLHDREGIPFMLSRTGYTGELGYEIFCAESDAVALWDAIVAAGEPYGLKPMGGAALETIRVEAGLAAANAEFAPGVDAFEAGLGFAVNLNKSDFTGKPALLRNAEQPRRLLKGLLIDGDDVPPAGAQVFKGERPVGVVTSATRSPSLQRAIAMARIATEYADEGATLEIGLLDGHMKRLQAEVSSVPFVDPQRTRARA